MQINSRPSCFRQADGDRLLSRTSAVFAFPDMLDLFADELSGLCACSFAFLFVLFGFFERLLLRHLLRSPVILLSKLELSRDTRSLVPSPEHVRQTDS